VLARAPTSREAAILASLAERRGWTLAASALMNLDEAITK
jgi:hypothetical protein